LEDTPQNKPQNKLQTRRLPIYLSGFLLGTMGVYLVTQAKRASAPDFAEVADTRAEILLPVGGQLRLRLGDDPGKNLVWGFPTQLMIGKREEGGRMSPLARLEYRDLVEKETLLGPFPSLGEYEVRAQFFTCAFPGEKYCAKIALVQPVKVITESAAREPLVDVDVKGAAEKASANGKLAEDAAKQKALAPTP
jgi:hypothetical protein